jgi:hypothetical protein
MRLLAFWRPRTNFEVDLYGTCTNIERDWHNWQLAKLRDDTKYTNQTTQPSLDHPPLPRAITMGVSAKKLPARVAKLSNTCAFASESPACKLLIVQHNYHDHASDPVPPADSAAQQNVEHNFGTSQQSAFPLKLYEILSLVERDGFSSVISWQPHGRCFVVHKPDEFKIILPRYFKKLSKVASFQRQLNLYGFMRLTRGIDKGGYYHELFLQGKPWLAQQIQRVRVKGTGVRAKSNPAQEPNFWSMPCTTRGSKADSTVRITPTEAPVTTPVTTSAPPAVASTTHRQHFGDDCTASVVSQDEEEPPRLPHRTVAPPPVQSVAPSSADLGEPEDDSLIDSWGMSFYYLSQPESPYSRVIATPFTIDDDIEKILGNMDVNEVMRDFFDNTEGHSVVDLLEQVSHESIFSLKVF